MSFHHLDRFAAYPSPVTRTAPAARLLGTVAVALGAALLPSGAWPQMLVMILLVAGLAAVARIPAGAFLLRLAPPLGFVLLVSAGVLVLAPGEPVASAGPVTVTDAGLLRFGSIVGRAAPALGAAVILVSTTPFGELVEALRELRLPRVVTTTLGLAYRYIYLLRDEVERLRRAARSRNAGDGAASRRRLLTGITAAALTRSLARSERTHRAMQARGFAGRLRTLDPSPLDARSVARAAALTAVVAGVVAWALAGGPA